MKELPLAHDHDHGCHDTGLVPICLCLPSRGRPHRLATFIDSAVKTATHPVTVKLYLDSDDDTEAYRQALAPFVGKVLMHVLIGERDTFLSRTYDCLWTSCPSNAIVGYFADDVEFVTPGWDDIVRAEFATKPVLLLSDSQTPQDPANNPMHGFVSMRACDALGYLLPGCYEHGYADRDIHDVYSRAGAPVVFTSAYSIVHRHFHGEPGLLDDVYRARSLVKDNNGMTCDDRDRLVFEAKEEERRRDAEKLRRLL